MSTTKNIGQVAGLFIGTSAPQNTTLIWFDSTTNQRCHKVFDPKTGLWKVLDPGIVALTTYSELVNNAKKNGLSIGKFYQITDKSNVLAITIGVTKVQYTDALGNLLVDDLGTNIQYHVSSGNLLIDDITGVFNTETNKLVFSFNEQDPSNDDYIFGKKRNGTKWDLFKSKISSLVSKVTGNSITWNEGLFFDFSNAIKSLHNKAGGVVGYDAYSIKIKSVEEQIQNVSKNNQTIIQNANKAIVEATTNSVIFNKQIPEDIDIKGAPIDILLNDTLFTIISKFQRWINQFKYATGIRISKSFKESVRGESVNNNDTVESAFSKIQYWINKLKTGNNINVSSEEYQSLNSLPENITEDDDLTTAIAKLEYWAKNSAFDSATTAYGVLPTDICKVIAFWPLSAITPTTFTGLGIGCVVVQGQNNQLFSRNDAHLYDFYSFYPYFPQSSTHPKILGFAPVIPVMINDSMQYSSACPFVHYAGEGGVTMQLIICIPKTMLEGWQADGYIYLECDPSATVYGKQANIPSKTLLMSYTNFFNFWITENELKAGTGRNIDFFVTLTRKKTL